MTGFVVQGLSHTHTHIKISMLIYIYIFSEKQCYSQLFCFWNVLSVSECSIFVLVCVTQSTDSLPNMNLIPCCWKTAYCSHRLFCELILHTYSTLINICWPAIRRNTGKSRLVKCKCQCMFLMPYHFVKTLERLQRRKRWKIMLLFTVAIVWAGWREWTVCFHSDWDSSAMSHIKQITFEGNQNNQIVLHNPRKTEEKIYFCYWTVDLCYLKVMFDPGLVSWTLHYFTSALNVLKEYPTPESSRRVHFTSVKETVN